MRLIDADALINKLKRNSIFEKITDCRGMNTIEIIEEQPTAYYVGNEYNKGIDDFAERIIEVYSYLPASIVKELAEQLKY